MEKNLKKLPIKTSLISLLLAINLLLNPLSACNTQEIDSESIREVYSAIGIDVSRYNSGSGDLEAIKKLMDERDYAIIRIASSDSSIEQTQLRTVSDPTAINFVKACEEIGKPYGFYIRSNALTPEEAIQEGKVIKESIEEIEAELGHKLSYCIIPFAIDIEYDNEKDRHYGNEEETTKAIKVLVDFLLNNNIIPERNYYMIYTNPKGLYEILDIARKVVYPGPCFSINDLAESGYKPFCYWIAAYDEKYQKKVIEFSKSNPNFSCFIIQFTDNGNTLDENMMISTAFILLIKTNEKALPTKNNY